MKPQFIKKKTAQRLREGHFDDLMGTITEVFDIYTAKEFNRGWNACVDDLDVFAGRLAKHILYEPSTKGFYGVPPKVLNVDTVELMIKQFCNENIRTKG